jgi:hypothetical protein
VSNGFRKHEAGFTSARQHIFGRDKCCYPCRAAFTPSNACDQDLDQGYLWEQTMDTDMSRSEKIVTSLSVAVLVAGYRDGGVPEIRQYERARIDPRSPRTWLARQRGV